MTAARPSGRPLTSRADRGMPLYLGGDSSVPRSLRTVWRTLGRVAERVPDPSREQRPPAAAQALALSESAGTLEFLAADRLKGLRVLNGEDELVGKVRDLIIDVRRGTAAYVLMSSGGVIGFGDRQHVVPWPALSFDARRRCFVLEVSRERMREAPVFDRERWLSLADPAFAGPVHQFYGVSPD